MQNKFREGMQVFASDQEQIGKIEQIHGDGFHVRGVHVPDSAVARVDGNRVYLAKPWSTYNQATAREGTMTQGETREGEIRVPVVEERLNVGKRAVEGGEVGIRKTVTTEQVNVPVELTREEVRVERVDVPDRPVRPGEDVFKEGTIRVPVRSEEAVVNKEAVVTGEVVINKDRTTDRQMVSDTVRREQVEVDKNYERAQPKLQQHFNNRARAVGGSATTTNRTWETAEPNYRFGFNSGYDQRFRGRKFEEVEPELRREWETTTTTRGTTGGDNRWDLLREEVQEGFDRSRNS